MNPINVRNAGVLLLIGSALLFARPGLAAPTGEASFEFRGAAYHHRWSHNTQHEFTPKKQEDLEKWTDMITLNGYPSVSDGKALAAQANAVLENYKSYGARVLKTDSVPRTADRPAEHLIAVVFSRASFVEVAFARVKLVDGKGWSFVYSHRIYGEKAADAMSAWLRANRPTVENAVMESRSWPAPDALTKQLLRTRS